MVRLDRAIGIRNGHKAQALFTSSDDPSIAHVVTLPLGTFPHLALGTIWSDGVFDGHDVLDTKTVRISVLRQSEKAWIECRLSDVVPEAIYPTHGLGTPADCFLILADSGEELIVPYAEILRAWYFFDSAVIPAVSLLAEGSSLLVDREIPHLDRAHP